MKNYTITITERQAQIISLACEILARLGIGQWRHAIEQLPLKDKIDYEQWHKDLDYIGTILMDHTIDGVDGWRRSHGIHSKKVSDTARVAWDIHHVIRHRLAWERAVKEGLVESLSSPRDWSKMMTVDYDEPSQIGEESLAVIQKKQEENVCSK